MLHFIKCGLAFCLLFSAAFAQSNILRNGGFEADWGNSHYPRANQTLDMNAPDFWEVYNNDNNSWERWYIDSLWVPAHQNDPDPGLQPGFYNISNFNSAMPWESGSFPDTMTLQTASEGECYVGFDTKTDDPTREGIQQEIGSCPLNSGDYTCSLRWARTYQSPVKTKTYLSLARRDNRRHYKFDNFKVNVGTFTPGQWNSYSTNFEVKLNNNHRELKWFSITGQRLGNSHPQHYMYYDDVRLFRQCDVDSACFNPTGQICPVFATPGPPGPPMMIQNISNANEIQVKISTAGGAELIDTTYFNANGFPDFYFAPEILAGNVSSAGYPYEVTVRNKCGAVEFNGTFLVLSGIYDTLAQWVDTTANWSETPIPCCLHTLTLKDQELVGDIDFIVKDKIIVSDGVTAANGSDIYMQAPEIELLDSVEYDGSVATVEMIEAPCQGCRMAPPSPGGTPPDPATIGKDAVLTGSRPKVKHDAPIRATEAGNVRSVSQTELLPDETQEDFDIGIWAYPNPFQNSIMLEVELSRTSPVTVTVYDGQMREVLRVVKVEKLSPGIHTYSADLSNETAGIYFVQLVADGQTFTEKIVKQ